MTCSAREWLLAPGDVADEVEGVECGAAVADFLGQLVKEDALRFEFGDDGGFLVGIVPGVEEVVERAEALAELDARVVLERFGDQLAVDAVVLDALIDHVDRHVVDDVFDARGGVGGWQRIGR